MKLTEFVDQYGDCEIKDEDKLKELLVYKKKKWKPKNGEEYFFLNVRGNITLTTNEGSKIDEDIINHNIVFETKQEAERYKEIQTACRKASFEPDWENGNQKKHYFCYDCLNKKLIINKIYYNVINCQFYFESEEIAQSLIDKFGEKDIAKYVLGVDV